MADIHELTKALRAELLAKQAYHEKLVAIYQNALTAITQVEDSFALAEPQPGVEQADGEGPQPGGPYSMDGIKQAI